APIAWRRAPSPMANMDARTPTAQATPITMVNTNPNRWGMLARLIHNSAQYCFINDDLWGYLSARASTTRSLAARTAGRAALTSATTLAATIATSMTTSGMVSPGIH